MIRMVLKEEFLKHGQEWKVGFNSLVYSIRALSRRSGLRTTSTTAKPCQGDSSEFYLITGSIYTDQRGTMVLAILFNESEQRRFRLYERQIRVIDDFKPVDLDDVVDKEKVLEEPGSTKVKVKLERDEESIRKRPGRRLKMKATKKSQNSITLIDMEQSVSTTEYSDLMEVPDVSKLFFEMGDLRTMFEETANVDLWKNQEEWILKSWNFYENYRVHTLTFEDGTEIYMLAEKRYLLTKETIERMLALRLIAESESEAVFDLLRFIQKQIDESESHDGSEKDI
nr:hypothetical protein [Tanacetum cinerariifolium]